MSPTPYDELRYPGKFYPQSSPGRLAVVARLHGLDPPALRSARILELACGEGGQLVPIAEAFPASRCLGLDLSAGSIERARGFAHRVGADNCEFRAGDLRDFPADAGEFDYIIAHGLYSWVPEPVRQALLALCARHLSATGLAYISYNAYPGGHIRQILRDLTTFQTRDIDDPVAKVGEARKVAELIGAAMPPDSLEHRLFERLLSAYRDSDALIRFDLLSEENDPVYFLDFMQGAQAAGLQFVAESSAPVRDPATMPETVRGWLDAIADRLVREQYLDFISCRGFRQTVLCRGSGIAQAEPAPVTLAGLYVRCALQPLDTTEPLDVSTSVKFRNPLGAELSCSEALPKACYLELGEAYPRALAYEELRQRVGRRLGAEGRLDPPQEAQLTGILLRSDARGVVELYAEPPTFATEPRPKPQVRLLARLQAEQGLPIAVRGASGVMRVEPPVRALLSLLDGSRNRQQLLAGWAQAAGDQFPVHPAALERTLRLFANEGLLT